VGDARAEKTDEVLADRLDAERVPVSRHTLRSDERWEVVVGYDPPLDTYFCQVYDMQASEEEPIVWTGVGPQELTNVRAALEPLREFVDLSPEEWDKLAGLLKQERKDRREPTRFQRDMFRRMTGGELP
jgi:hypothetical protein